MRVTIEHREQAAGVLKNHRESYIDCRVEFSEEEKAIIKARDLYRNGFSAWAATPLAGKPAVIGTGLLRILAPLLAIIGLIWGFAGGGNLAGLLLFAGIGLFLYGWIAGRKQDKRAGNDEQQITIKRLLGNPSFTVYAFDPAAAKGYELQLREHLQNLKDLLINSAQIQGKQSFEL